LQVQLLLSSVMANNLVSLPIKRDSKTAPTVTNGLKNSGAGSLLPAIARTACVALLSRLSVTQCTRCIQCSNKYYHLWAIVKISRQDQFYDDQKKYYVLYKQVSYSTETLQNTYLPAKRTFVKCDPLVIITV
jgi:hypothetical protein